MPISDRPTWRGLPVPWVTRWTGEKGLEDENAFRTGVLALDWPTTYEDETILDRDRRYGMLMPREKHGNLGEPEFSQVHTHRQMRCMIEPRCQVCGDRLDSSKPIPWMLSTFQAVAWKAEGARTENAPVCWDCIDQAATLCPHMTATGAIIFEVEKYALTHVFMELGYRVENGPHSPIVHERKTLPLNSPLVRMGVVRQMVVTWTKFRAVEMYVQKQRMDLEGNRIG